MLLYLNIKKIIKKIDYIYFIEKFYIFITLKKIVNQIVFNNIKMSK